ncbi:hypothetical protein EJ02DRAFT_428792 [Clathrospora elynae]|uniref:Uncharacterized protein n=1 Tax=Clathrospora elynae TaxID=706981 RepID=A0A6A5S308_9PLEO|nr:hypothetical protein EJ02DRAFT_428792 [Clathrospora elynae]
MDYLTRRAQLDQKLTRLRDQVNAATQQLNELESGLTTKGKMPTNRQDVQLRDAKRRINVAAEKYERAVADFDMDMEKRHEEAKQKLCDEVEKYAKEAGVTLKLVKFEDIVLP